MPDITQNLMQEDSATSIEIAAMVAVGFLNPFGYAINTFSAHLHTDDWQIKLTEIENPEGSASNPLAEYLCRIEVTQVTVDSAGQSNTTTIKANTELDALTIVQALSAAFRNPEE